MNINTALLLSTYNWPEALELVLKEDDRLSRCDLYPRGSRQGQYAASGYASAQTCRALPLLRL